MKTLLDMATRDLRYADFLERIGQKDVAERIRNEVRGLIKDAPRSNPRLQLTGLRPMSHAPQAKRPATDTMRVTIIQNGLRESGSSGDGVWVADQQLWFVTLDRASPPFRGYYAADEVALHRPQDGEVFAQLPPGRARLARGEAG